MLIDKLLALLNAPRYRSSTTLNLHSLLREAHLAPTDDPAHATGLMPSNRIPGLTARELTVFVDTIAARPKLFELSMDDAWLYVLPDNIGRLRTLRRLTLSHNRLRTLPSAVGQLTQLEHLDLSNNQLSALPDTLAELRNLRYLNAANNRLSTLPESMSRHGRLTELYLHNNDLGIPPEILGAPVEASVGSSWSEQASSALRPYFSHDPLPHIPRRYNDEPAQLPPEVQSVLDALAALPPEARHELPADILSQLSQKLMASLGDRQKQDSNEDRAGSSVPELLYDLIAGHLRGKRAADVLKSLRNKRKPRHDRPKPTTTPAEILDYYFRPKPRQPLNEAKILLIGQGGVGKTSIVKRLLDNRFDDREPKTEGINIMRLHMPTHATTSSRSSPGVLEHPDSGPTEEIVGKHGHWIRRTVTQGGISASPAHDPKQQQSQGELGVDAVAPPANMPNAIRLNLWDFGGQEIMHATHQFFLTKRSAYVLVLDARAGEREGNLHYWLEMVRVYGGDSPLLVVMNKCEQHYERLDERRLLLDYEGRVNIVGFHYVSCKTGEGVVRLRAQIEALISELPHVWDLLPEDYFRVKTELEQRAVDTDFITQDEYEAVCVQQGVSKREDQSRLLRFLHDLGCVLHYDDPDQVYQLRDTRVLNPEWVTGGVYRLLNDPTLLRQADGIVSRADLERVLHADADGRRRFPRDRHPFLIDIMRKYELCIDFVDDRKTVLVPELLSRNEPDAGWIRTDDERADTLNFEYHYAVLPRGLVPRFVVRSQRLFSDRRTCWRLGVVLDVEGCRVLVRGDIRTAKVFIQVQGKSGRRRALAVVRNTFESIHATYGDLGVDGKVPLPLDPHAPPVDFRYLIKLEQDGVQEQLIEKAKFKYSVSALLNGVDDRAYDTFVCHSSKDKDAARELRALLRKRGIRCWLDEDDLTPGRPWQPELSEALRTCRSIAVLIGPEGSGPWQKMELQLALAEASSSDKMIIPVLLPGANVESAGLPGPFDFLKLRTWVNLSAGFEEATISRMAQAIWVDCIKP